MATVEQSNNFLCPACGKTLKSHASFKKHQARHGGSKLCCEFCGKFLSSKRELGSHLLTYHGQGIDKAFQCGVCGKLFYKECAWRVHHNSHNGIKPFRCSICDKQFSQKKSLLLHHSSHDGHSSSSYSRKECELTYVSPFQGKHYLDPLGLVTDSFPGITSHRNVVLSKVGDGNEATHFNFLTSTTQNALHQGEKISPNYSSTTEVSFTAGKPYFCSLSDCAAKTRQFRRRQSLNKHNARYHSSNKKLYTCEICYKEFVEMRSLRLHKQLRHSSAATLHTCSMCSRTFTQKSKLSRHLKLHLEEPRFRCDVCGKKYHRKDNLDNHRKSHCASSCRFSCHICEKGFDDLKKMEEHVNHHLDPDHSCLQCTKAFTTKAALRYHNDSAHNQISKFNCAVCGKKFFRKCHYNTHLNIHIQNPVQCVFCFKKFNGNTYYRRHLKRVHSSFDPPSRQ